jgi:hypothetical protein
LFFGICLGIPAYCQASSTFTFSDGTTTSCRTSSGKIVEQVYLPQLAANFVVAGYTGVTTSLPDGSARITWNIGKLNSLSAAPHDYIYFHECAHAHVPTSDELVANCVGLVDMREAGRSSPGVESELQVFHAALGDMGPPYGTGSQFWAKTAQCAAGVPPKQQIPSDSSLTTTCRFQSGPLAGQTIDFGGRPGVTPAMIGAQCTDGNSSYGIAVRMSGPTAAAGIVGNWKGVLTGAAGKLTLIFHIAEDGAGTVDSVSQGAFGLPMQYSMNGNRIKMVVPSVGAVYAATVTGNRMTGLFSQGGDLPLQLDRQ